ncbi:interleukin enhancer-binding factor 3-like [Anastrepha ludens]|uniref:interleukin enhancer-binding factor 3-like n=1 Tax=Anastrepha ludens TaxID=28586 RepID=UPI0023AF70B2|nr:interleukin enhancer-binding factor 3-like [Anastrepha ludens]
MFNSKYRLRRTPADVFQLMYPSHFRTRYYTKNNNCCGHTLRPRPTIYRRRFIRPLLLPTPDHPNMNGYSRKSPSKRRYEGSKYPVLPKKKPRTGKERVPQPKNTVAMLNELRHGLVYKLESQTGPVHAPLFTISVEVSIVNDIIDCLPFVSVSMKHLRYWNNPF